MRLVLRVLVAATTALVLIMVVVIGDLALNKRRMFYALLGRDAIERACTPVLLAKLKESGFEPDELTLGDTPDVTVSTLTGKTFKDTFTFADGPAGGRVDGIMACSVLGARASVEFRTSASPVRAT